MLIYIQFPCFPSNHKHVFMPCFATIFHNFLNRINHLYNKKFQTKSLRRNNIVDDCNEETFYLSTPKIMYTQVSAALLPPQFSQIYILLLVQNLHVAFISVHDVDGLNWPNDFVATLEAQKSWELKDSLWIPFPFPCSETKSLCTTIGLDCGMHA